MSQSETTHSTISQRAQSALVAGSKNLMWDVVNDLCFLNRQLDLPAKLLTYNDGPTGSARVKRAVSAFINRHFRPLHAVEPSHLFITNGVSSAIEHMSWAITEPGEGILLGRPYYGTFIPDISLRPGATVIPVSFDDCDPFSLEAVQKYEQALLSFQETTGRKVKGLALCHPHNPLGRCYPRHVLVKLMELCQKYQMHFISDEIYALSVWTNTVDESPKPVDFESSLSLDLTGIIDPQLVHILWGVSKDFGANGLRLGVIISQANRDMLMALRNVGLYSYVSGVSEHLVSLLLEDVDFTDEYIRLNREKLSENYSFVAKQLKSNGIEYSTGANAAFFIWMNLGKKYRELHPEVKGDEDVSETVMELLLQKKVFLASGSLFGSEHGGWYRIVFSQPQEYLSEAVRRIMAALEA
ncbi:aspartate aminotransferase [Aspergillus nomiae NRRL 13137]|uniref:Aspartate aminotransferase n=1 Tax=Aspergillus nomiae NRRL (strain ATCC 15546 / NRRL 13137 / CBS 260.88 / M93) TaxID=1509407 RepID=A0A0L1JFZ9_ASPN3|nr:aspartate aminotransferase [Aspergillus nomiae NRRL 13137]KNG90681.1 aspartate aminotransferase [Aspergillus nomiae NRRL 13137]